VRGYREKWGKTSEASLTLKRDIRSKGKNRGRRELCGGQMSKGKKRRKSVGGRK
jgi:hypothetical protein